MEFEPEMKKKSSILKKLERYLSMNRRKQSSSSSATTRPTSMFSKSRSWRSSTPSNHGKNPSKTPHISTPNGCFSVYVGPEKQRFVIETKYLYHSLFRMLLEDAETEYGFNCDGPLLLPCEVDLFCKVVAEMKCSTTDYSTHSSCSPFVNPARRLGKSDMAKGYSSYGLLTPPRWLKINHFYSRSNHAIPSAGSSECPRLKNGEL